MLYGLNILIECLSHSTVRMKTVPGNITVYGITQLINSFGNILGRPTCQFFLKKEKGSNLYT